LYPNESDYIQSTETRVTASRSHNVRKSFEGQKLGVFATLPSELVSHIVNMTQLQRLTTQLCSKPATGDEKRETVKWNMMHAGAAHLLYIQIKFVNAAIETVKKE
jgi:hypothetical protein